MKANQCRHRGHRHRKIIVESMTWFGFEKIPVDRWKGIDIDSVPVAVNIFYFIVSDVCFGVLVLFNNDNI